MTKRNSLTVLRTRGLRAAERDSYCWGNLARILIGTGVALAYVVLCTLAGRCVLRLAYGYWHAPPGVGTGVVFLAEIAMLSCLLVPLAAFVLIAVIGGLYLLGDATLYALRFDRAPR